MAFRQGRDSNRHPSDDRTSSPKALFCNKFSGVQSQYRASHCFIYLFIFFKRYRDICLFSKQDVACWLQKSNKNAVTQELSLALAFQRYHFSAALCTLRSMSRTGEYLERGSERSVLIKRESGAVREHSCIWMFLFFFSFIRIVVVMTVMLWLGLLKETRANRKLRDAKHHHPRELKVRHQTGIWDFFFFLVCLFVFSSIILHVSLRTYREASTQQASRKSRMYVRLSCFF